MTNSEAENVNVYGDVQNKINTLTDWLGLEQVDYIMLLKESFGECDNKDEPKAEDA